MTKFFPVSSGKGKIYRIDPVNPVLTVPPPVRKAPLPGKPPAFLLIFWPVKNRQVDHLAVRIYSPEKTLADCFKFRNKVGLDTVMEAVRFYRERKSVQVDELMRYAAICRVKKIIRPYLEALF